MSDILSLKQRIHGMNRWLILLALLAPSPLLAQTMSVNATTQELFRNFDGSCVQCSLSLLGAHRNDPSLYTLLWDTEYGPAEHGGSGPGRVSAYCRDRRTPIYNVTASRFDQIKPWLLYAAKTGRMGGVGAFNRHFQTFWGMSPDGKYTVQNNWVNTFGKPYVYTESQMKDVMEASGLWLVIRRGPPPAPDPVLVKWWKD